MRSGENNFGYSDDDVPAPTGLVFGNLLPPKHVDLTPHDPNDPQLKEALARMRAAAATDSEASLDGEVPMMGMTDAEWAATLEEYS